jgi:peptide/nickel transport system permease protein
MVELAYGGDAAERIELAMIAAFARRAAEFFATLLFAAAAIFLLLHLLPGDPAAVMLGLNAPPELVIALHRELGLDQPVLARLGDWFRSLLQGDFGTAFSYRVPVRDLFLERLAVTAPLAFLSLTLTLVFGLCLGCYAALHAYRKGDAILKIFSQLALAIPNFWLGLLLILSFAVQWRLFPAGGFAGWENGIGQGLRSLLLPALSLSLAQSAILLRITRAALLDTLSEPYMRTARAKGLSRAQSLWRHALPNTLLPVLALLGLQLTFLLTGAIVVENVFALPGVGRLLFQAVSQHDLPLVQNLLLIFVAVILAVNFLVDLAAISLDPRLRAAKEAA